MSSPASPSVELKRAGPFLEPILRDLLNRSGVNGATARGYLVALMRAIIGDRTGGLPGITPPAELAAWERAFIERRARELLDSARNRLPAMDG